MIAQNKTKNANFIRIINMLRHLRDTAVISPVEYNRARKYYQKLVGADIVIAE